MSRRERGLKYLNGHPPNPTPTPLQKIAVVTLQTFHRGKLELLTVSLGKLKFASVTDFSLAKLPWGNFISLGLNTSKEQTDLLWISLDSYLKATERENKIPR